MITHYLFDLDDTLIDTKIYAEIYPLVLKMIQKKLKIDPEQKAQQFKLKRNKFGRYDSGELCRHLGLLDDYYLILKKQIKVENYLHDTVLQVLTKLKQQDCTIGIVSNSMSRTIQLYLIKYQLISLIDFVFSVDDARCSKREQKYWQTLIKNQHLKPAECLIIGDDETEDIKIPSSFGFKTLLIRKPEDLKKCLNKFPPLN